MQTDNMAASRPVASLLDEWGRIRQKVDLSRHHDASTDIPKVLDRWGAGVQGHVPLGKFAIVGLRRALFLRSIGLEFEENITLETLNAGPSAI